MITSQVQFQIAKFKFRQYQNTFFRHFAKFNARQIFRYTVYVIFFTIARGRPWGGAGIVRQIPYLSQQLSPGGGGGAYH